MDELLELTNVYLVDPLLGDVASTTHASYAPWSESYSMHRQFLVLWAFLYINSMLVYVLFASCTFASFFLTKRRENIDPQRKEHHAAGGLLRAAAHTLNPAYWPWDAAQIREEIWVSTWSLFIMAGFTACVDLYFLLGGSRIYHSVDEYGWLYFCLSPLLFLAFTDTLIYWIHRILHWPSVYWLHKLHHTYKETTPWSAFCFHPLDGFAQSVPYHLFVLVFPMHSRLYMATLGMVGLWTVNIHDRMTLRLWGVNGAAHHTIHHTKFNYNYGQYFTFWDRFWGTHKDPYALWPYELDEAKLAEVAQREREENALAKAKALARGKKVVPLDAEPGVTTPEPEEQVTAGGNSKSKKEL